MSDSVPAILGIVVACLMIASQLMAKSPATTTPTSYSPLSETENQSGGRKRATKRRGASHNKSKRK